MKIFSDEDKVVDERIEGLKNKVSREAIYIIYAILIISLITKSIIYEESFIYSITEYSILLVTGIYFMVRYFFLGINADENELKTINKNRSQKKRLILFIIPGVFLSLYFAVNSAINYAENAQEKVTYFCSVFLGSTLIYIPMFVVIFLLNELRYKNPDIEKDKD